MILEASGLSKKYFSGVSDEAAFLAVNDVSLSIGRGEFVCIVGRSGSGKSTLVNMLAGMLPPTSGDITFLGRRYADLSDGELSALRGAKIGYIMQGYGVLPNFTVFQNVLMPHFFNRQQINPEGRALYLLEQAGIAHLASRYPQRLSGGELRRVSIARALLNSPELLVADEPTSDLDVETTGEIMSFFASTARLGTAILMVSHEPDAAKYCDACYSMRSGSLEPF